jgi:hypothetical protein
MKNKIIYSLMTAGLFACAAMVQAQQQGQKYYQTPKPTNNGTRLRTTQPTALILDTVKMPKYVSRDLEFEVPAEKGALIQFTNSTRNLDIRTWAESKVKIVTTVNVKETDAASITKEKMMEEGGLSVKSFGNRVNIESKALHGVYEYYMELPSLAFPKTDWGKPAQNNKLRSTNSNVQVTTAETELAEHLLLQQSKSDLYHTLVASTGNKVMTVFIPEGCKLDIDNKGTDILINSNVGQASFKLSRSNLDARDFQKLSVIADYSTLNISTVYDAEIELENGNLTAGMIKNLDLDAKDSEIEYEGGDYCYLRSQSDRITIDEISKIDGRKLYGDLRIGKLKQSIDIEGANADIKIRHLTPEVESIKLNNKYADLRLPVKQLTNYTVNFTGSNSTVFAPFEKIPVAVDVTALTKENIPIKTLKLTPVEKNLKETAASPNAVTFVDGEAMLFNRFNTFGEVAPVKFTASVGTPTGKFTRFEIVCHQCSVDFK